MGNDEGVSRAELRTMLTAILQSTNTILYTVGHTDRAVLGGEDMQETITVMVDAAFANCDISRTGKLLPMVRGGLWVCVECVCVCACDHGGCNCSISRTASHGVVVCVCARFYLKELHV